MACCWKRKPERRPRYYYLILLVIVASWVFALPRGYAESLVSLTEGADRIVMVIPVQKASFWQDGIIKTRVLLKVERVIEGGDVGREISVLYDGGVVGTVGLRVSHGVILHTGQKAILFLVDEGDHYAVFHDAAGVFLVRSLSGKEVVISSHDTLNWPEVTTKDLKREGGTVGEGIPLPTFISRIHHLWGDRP